jgi:hypothetical protein
MESLTKSDPTDCGKFDRKQSEQSQSDNSTSHLSKTSDYQPYGMANHHTISRMCQTIRDRAEDQKQTQVDVSIKLQYCQSDRSAIAR